MIINVQYTTATLTTEDIKYVEMDITDHGHCWSLRENPAVDDSTSGKSQMSAYSGGSYTSQLSGLICDTTYYIRSFIQVNGTYIYFQDTTMKTLKPANPAIGETDILSITQTGATVRGNVELVNGDSIIERGVCWNTTPGDYPTINDNKISDTGSIHGTIECIIGSLEPNTEYYIRTYATNNFDITGYGRTDTIRTRGIPTVHIRNIFDIRPDSVKVTGEISSDGDSEITGYGVCWNTTGKPDINKDNYSGESGAPVNKEYTVQMTGLAPSTYYYIRSYATNRYGTGYDGKDSLFHTLSGIPVLSATNITQVQSTSLICCGEIKSDEGADITERGICWNTTGSPDIYDNKVIARENETDSFCVTISGLLPNTNIYFRAYASNDYGTGYGPECDTITTACDAFTEGSGEICDQVWSMENADVGIMIDSSKDQRNNSINEYYCYANDENNCDDYGGMYQWNEMMKYSTVEGSRGICPAGYHIPSESEWQRLINNLGGISVAGSKLKEAGTSHWQTPNDATNESYFTALPGGYRSSEGLFSSIRRSVCYWTSTDNGNQDYAFYRSLYYNNSEVPRTFGSKSTACYVRCIKDK